MATKYEIKERDNREYDVLAALRSKITQPWHGTYTALARVLGVPRVAYWASVPTLVPMSPRVLSGTLSALESGGRLSGWTLHRWRTPKARMVALVPPGWTWDDENRRWLVNGVPIPAE